MSRLSSLRTLVLAVALVAGAACAQEPPGRLPALKLDPARVAVVGLSSGAYMATQAQLAYPEVFHGAAMVAGGPYGCAGGSLQTALSSCMKGTPAMSGAFGSLYGEHDQRASVFANFTYLQNFQVGVGYNAFLGSADLAKRPYADRDYAAINLKYSF